jgi:hypothetical protein
MGSFKMPRLARNWWSGSLSVVHLSDIVWSPGCMPQHGLSPEGVRLQADRQHYILGLAALRDKFAEARRTSDWRAVDAEIRRYPAPKDSGSNALSKLLVAEWASPRHEYVFRSNGTWSILPAEPGTTCGRWRIEGNQYYDTSEVDRCQAGRSWRWWSNQPGVRLCTFPARRVSSG